MNQKELKELIEFLIEKDIAEFELERGDVKVRIKRGAEPAHFAWGDSRYFAVHSAPPPAPELATKPAVPAAPAAGMRRPNQRPDCTWCIPPSWARSTNRPSPGSPPFVKVGDVVEVGQVLCIVEAMKLMNEIESDVAGEMVTRADYTMASPSSMGRICSPSGRENQSRVPVRARHRASKCSRKS